MSMPRYVDHDARRRHIAVTAAELVGARGLEALTFRNVAEAAGSSTTVLTHYFTDKRDLLSSTFEVVAERSGARFDDARRNGGSLRECLEALLPLDPERQTEWRLLTCYWGMGVSDPVAAGEQARHVRSAQHRIETLLRQHHPQIAEAELEVVGRPAGHARARARSPQRARSGPLVRGGPAAGPVARAEFARLPGRP